MVAECPKLEQKIHEILIYQNEGDGVPFIGILAALSWGLWPPQASPYVAALRQRL